MDAQQTHRARHQYRCSCGDAERSLDSSERHTAVDDADSADNSRNDEPNGHVARDDTDHGRPDWAVRSGHDVDGRAATDGFDHGDRVATDIFDDVFPDGFTDGVDIIDPGDHCADNDTR